MTGLQVPSGGKNSVIRQRVFGQSSVARAPRNSWALFPDRFPA